MPKLVFHDSEAVDKVLSLGTDPILIGRGTDCQVRTDDAMVSRKHARIVWDGNYWIEDLGSANGVYVGTEKVTRAPFRPGDVVTCGSLVMRLLPETGPLAAKARTPSARRIAGVDTPPAGSGVATNKDSLGKGGRTANFEELIREAHERVSAAEARAAILEAGAKESERLKKKIEQLDAELTRLRAQSKPQRRARSESDTDPGEGEYAATAIAEIDPQLLDEAGALVDHLADVKGSLRAASDEARLLKMPPESVKLVRDSLKAATAQLSMAREQLRLFLKHFGVD